jgi:uncharacterized protein YbjQ (UPF0145 family)
MIITTTETVTGKKTVRTIGWVKGNTIRARHIGKDIVASLRGIVGGEIVEYTKMMAEAREQAIDRMVEEAEALGADAVVMVRFQTIEMMRGAAEMLCYGTAVRLERTR